MVDGFFLRLISDSCWYLAIIMTFIPKTPKAIGIAFIPIGIYFILEMIFRRFWVDRQLYIVLFKVQSFLYFFIAFLVLCTGTVRLKWMFIFGAAFFFVGVLALRLLRMGRGANFKARLLNFGLLSGTLIVSAGIGYGIYRLIVAGKVVVEGLAWVFAGIITLVNKIAMIVRYDKLGEEFLGELVEEEATGNAKVANAVDFQNGFSIDLDGYDDLSLRIIVALVIVAIIVAIVLAIIRMIKKAVRSKYTDDLYFGQTEHMSVSEERTKKVKKSGNKAQLRKYYREYLKLIQSTEGVLKASDTSQDVLKKSGNVDKDSLDAQLRETYISARYKDEASVTDEQVKKVKTLIKEIKKGK